MAKKSNSFCLLEDDSILDSVHGMDQPDSSFLNRVPFNQALLGLDEHDSFVEAGITPSMVVKDMAVEKSPPLQKYYTKKGYPTQQNGGADYFCVVDVECTCNEDRNAEIHEIIQLPGCLVNHTTGQVESTFHCIIKPKTEQTAFCTKQTGVTQELIDNTVPLEVALVFFQNWLYFHNQMPLMSCYIPPTVEVVQKYFSSGYQEVYEWKGVTQRNPDLLAILGKYTDKVKTFQPVYDEIEKHTYQQYKSTVSVAKDGQSMLITNDASFIDYADKAIVYIPANERNPSPRMLYSDVRTRITNEKLNQIVCSSGKSVDFLLSLQTRLFLHRYAAQYCTFPHLTIQSPQVNISTLLTSDFAQWTEDDYLVLILQQTTKIFHASVIPQYMTNQNITVCTRFPYTDYPATTRTMTLASDGVWDFAKFQIPECNLKKITSHLVWCLRQQEQQYFDSKYFQSTFLSELQENIGDLKEYHMPKLVFSPHVDRNVIPKTPQFLFCDLRVLWKQTHQCAQYPQSHISPRGVRVTEVQASLRCEFIGKEHDGYADTLNITRIALGIARHAKVPILPTTGRAFDQQFM